MSLNCQQCRRNLFQEKKCYLLLLKRKLLHQLKVYFLCIVLINCELWLQFVFIICWESCVPTVVFQLFVTESLFLCGFHLSSVICCKSMSRYLKMHVLSISYTLSSTEIKTIFTSSQKRSRFHPTYIWPSFKNILLCVTLWSNLQN